MIHWLERMIAELDRYREMLQDAQDEALLKAFHEAALQRDQLHRRAAAPQVRRHGPKVDGRYRHADVRRRDGGAIT